MSKVVVETSESTEIELVWDSVTKMLVQRVKTRRDELFGKGKETVADLTAWNLVKENDSYYQMLWDASRKQLFRRALTNGNWQYEQADVTAEQVTWTKVVNPRVVDVALKNLAITQDQQEWHAQIEAAWPAERNNRLQAEWSTEKNNLKTPDLSKAENINKVEQWSRLNIRQAASVLIPFDYILSSFKEETVTKEEYLNQLKSLVAQAPTLRNVSDIQKLTGNAEFQELAQQLTSAQLNQYNPNSIYERAHPTAPLVTLGDVKECFTNRIVNEIQQYEPSYVPAVPAVPAVAAVATNAPELKLLVGMTVVAEQAPEAIEKRVKFAKRMVSAIEGKVADKTVAELNMLQKDLAQFEQNGMHADMGFVQRAVGQKVFERATPRGEFVGELMVNIADRQHDLARENPAPAPVLHPPADVLVDELLIFANEQKKEEQIAADARYAQELELQEQEAAVQPQPAPSAKTVELVKAVGDTITAFLDRHMNALMPSHARLNSFMAADEQFARSLQSEEDAKFARALDKQLNSGLAREQIKNDEAIARELDQQLNSTPATRPAALDYALTPFAQGACRNAKDEEDNIIPFRRELTI